MTEPESKLTPKSVLTWAEWLPASRGRRDGLARCPVCLGWFQVKIGGILRYHGPANRRCEGSLALPPEDGVRE